LASEISRHFTYASLCFTRDERAEQASERSLKLAGRRI